jgi:hypothetical protein
MPILGVIASSRLVAPLVGDFESIATVTVGSGGSSNNWNLLLYRATYSHLQLRLMAR